MGSLKVIGSALYQWEIGRKILVLSDTGDRAVVVQFAHPGDKEALSVTPREENGVIVAEVPNIMLQSGDKLVAFLVEMDENCVETTRHSVFHVVNRPKPADYIYTETEVLNYTYLDKRIKDLEGEGLANSVAAYLEENPVQAGATAEEAAQIKQNKQDIETLSREKLSAETLPGAVNDALAQAKASGLFDGADGKNGVDGKDGYTPVKGVDYFDGKDGQDGADGYTPQKGIDYFDGEKGEPGEPGQPGKTPEKGVDYMTPDEIQAAVEQVSGIVMGQICRVSVVIPDNGSAYADKTSSEIYAAWQAKAPIYCYVDLNDGEIPLMLSPFVIKEETATFAQISKTDGSTTCIMVTITGNTVEVEAFDIATKEDVPTDAHINSLIDAKLGVIENGTY